MTEDIIKKATKSLIISITVLLWFFIVVVIGVGGSHGDRSQFIDYITNPFIIITLASYTIFAAYLIKRGV